MVLKRNMQYSKGKGQLTVIHNYNTNEKINDQHDNA